MTIRGFVLLSAAAVTLVGCTTSTVAPTSAPASSASTTTTTTSATPSPTSSAAPKTLEAATAAEQEYVDRYTSGDRDGAYELLADEIRTNIPQATWVEIVNTCNTKATLHLDAKGVRMDGPDKAVVRVSLANVGATTRTVVYEDGVWHHGGDTDVRTWYGKSAADVIAMRKAKQDCS